MKAAILLVVAVTAAACVRGPGPEGQKKEIEFLTRGACAYSPAMQANLDAALKSLGRPLNYRVVSLEGLPPGDVRTGYPTPTVLIGGRDLFGMPVPVPPFPDPT